MQSTWNQGIRIGKSGREINKFKKGCNIFVFGTPTLVEGHA
jgi:hypothetical protein